MARLVYMVISKLDTKPSAKAKLIQMDAILLIILIILFMNSEKWIFIATSYQFVYIGLE